MNRQFLSVAIGTIGVVSFGTHYYLNRLFVDGRPRYEELRRPQEQHRIELYDLMARSYDANQNELESHNGVLAHKTKLMNFCKGHILEIGSATGRNLDLMIANNKIKSLTCVEKSSEMCNLLMKNIELKAPPFPVQVVECDAKDLPFDDNTFDTVVTTFSLCSLEHVTLGLKQIHRILNIHGRYLLLEPGSINWTILKYLMKLFKMYPNPRIPWEYGYFEDLEIIKLLESNHFIIKRQWYKNLRSIYIMFAGIKPHSKSKNINNSDESSYNNSDSIPSPRIRAPVRFIYYPKQKQA